MINNATFVFIDNKWYDITKFMPNHPGTKWLHLYNGRDISTIYKSIHKRTEIHPLLDRMLVKNFYTEPKIVDPKYEFNSPLALEIKKIYKNNYRIAPRIWWYRTYFINILWIITEWNYKLGPNFINSTILGIAFALMGLCIGHDGSHGAVGSARVNDLFAHYMDFIGSSALNWHHQHVRLHHPYTNEISRDPDTKAGQPLMEIHDVSKKNRYQRYMAPLLWIFGLSVVFNLGRIWRLKGRDTWLTVFLRLLFLYRVFYPSVLFGSYVVFVTGFILSNLFIISHNTPELERNPFNKSTCWYKCQIESSSTYGGKIAGFLTGGLNYQIEHHIFPNCNSCYLPNIHNEIINICKKNNVKYTYYPNLLTNIYTTYCHLFG